MKRIVGFFRKYDFPGQLFVAADVLVGQFSVCLWTLKTKLILRLMRCPYGRGLRVDGNPRIRVARHGAIELGQNVRLNSRFGSNLIGRTTPTVLHCIGHGRITFGDNSGCSFAVLSARTRITIGNQVRLGGNVRIYDHDYHALDHLARRDPRRDLAEVCSAPVEIGDDVLIGANVIILKGVRIGARSIVGAGAVVTLKEIPADSLVAGNPARIIRQLDPGAAGPRAARGGAAPA